MRPINIRVLRLRSSDWKSSLSDVPTDKIVSSSGAKISKRPLKRGHWWLENKERKCHFRFVERRFLAAINCTGSAEGALVPVLLCITPWTKSGLPVSPPGLFPPWPKTCNETVLRDKLRVLYFAFLRLYFARNFTLYFKHRPEWR